MFFFEQAFNQNLSQGWVLTGLSSILCVLGCFIIFLDDIYYLIVPKWVSSKYPFHLKENYAFMNGSLAFSGGCLLLTALYRLLPEAASHFKQSDPDGNYNFPLVASFLGGVTICGLFNQCLHLLTTESVVHCSHDGEKKPELDRVPELSHSHNHSHSFNEVPSHGGQHEGHSSSSHSSGDGHLHEDLSKSHAHSHYHDHDHWDEHHFSSASNGVPAKAASSSEDENTVHNVTETSNLLPEPNSLNLNPSLSRKKSLMHFIAHGSFAEEGILGECKGYSSAELCHYEQNGGLHFCEVPQLRKGENEDPHVESFPLDVHNYPSWDSHSHHKPAEHHHHHTNSPLSRLLLIGIQTILAITLHKFPEGFITYITLKTNPQLGVSIFLSLLIHNYTEGFLMCLPLYYSFGESKWRKWKAVGISSFLGGLSQPAGAFMGYLFMAQFGDGDIDVDKVSFVFGVSMAMTAGFLTVIALSMYGSAVSFSGLPNFVCVWSLIGMALICILTIFTRKD